MAGGKDTLSADTYEQLAKKLDEAIVGVPYSPTLIEILKVLFPGDEALTALCMSFQNMTAAEIATGAGGDMEEVGARLDRMAKRGAIFTEQQPGEERTYRLLPSIVGFSEAPFFAGEDTETTRALAPLWVKYLNEEFGGELERGTPLVRVVPITETLKDSSEILPFDALKERLEGVSMMAVAHCPCRQMKTFTGDGCEHSLENCMHFGHMARYIVDQGKGREIDKAEALKILEEATNEGLVHLSDNIDGMLTTICNCCGCCCAFLQAKRALGRNSLSRSNYVATVSAEDCCGCGTCEERCPIGAIVVGEDGIAVVDEAVCIGCGVCVPTCSTETAFLVKRAEVVPPPELGQFVTSRMKS